MIFVFLFTFPFVAVAIWCSYKIGYYSSEIKCSTARLDTLSHMLDILETNAHSHEWFEGALWAIKDSNPNSSSSEKEDNNV